MYHNISITPSDTADQTNSCWPVRTPEAETFQFFAVFSFFSIFLFKIIMAVIVLSCLPVGLGNVQSIYLYIIYRFYGQCVLEQHM